MGKEGQNLQHIPPLPRRAGGLCALLLALALLLGPAWAQAQENCEKANVLIVLDRSGSMGVAGRWEHAKGAVESILASYSSQVRFGLMLFPVPTLSECDPGAVQVPLGEDTTSEVLNWLAFTEPEGSTPMGATLTVALGYEGLHDPGRRNFVLLVTDGAEACGGDPLGAVGLLTESVISTFVVGFGSSVDPALLNAMAQAGGTANAEEPYYFQADDEAQLVTSLSDIMMAITAEVCDGQDNDCDGEIDEEDPEGGLSCDTGAPPPCQQGQTRCQEGQLVCDLVPTAAEELCDGQDNDCDGAIDEGNPEGGQSCNTLMDPPCHQGAISCIDGDLVCKPLAASDPELCDGLDNNCNGAIDEGDPEGGLSCDTGAASPCEQGLTHCQEGQLACDLIPLGAPEDCDGLDNDCNGHIDEGNPGGGEMCTTGLPAPCDQGLTLCRDGQIACEPLLSSEPELCDNQDNNCNGEIDDGNPGGGQACDTGEPPPCALGFTLCVAGDYICAPQLSLEPEVCDNLDNNCNGEIDEGNPDGGGACETGLPDPCHQGIWSCVEGELICQALHQGGEEVCDGLDNNCDGQIDEGNPGGGQACDTEQPAPCHQGSWTCLGGQLVCASLVEPQPETCDGVDNDCNGQIDDGNPGGGQDCTTELPAPCDKGVWRCVDGQLACVPPGAQPEVCDGEDNDCNGHIDDGNPGGGGECSTGAPPPCEQGTWQCIEARLICQAPPAAPEACDGLDNDCNSQIDDGNPGGGGPCDSGLPPPCQEAIWTCQEGHLVCTPLTPPQPEVCDGVDNDCNGQIDDTVGGEPCDTGAAPPCDQGVTRCVDGAITCSLPTTAVDEVCDGVDNDCNGQVDDGNPGGDRPCDTGAAPPCDQGVTRCVEGAVTCALPVSSEPEVCDGLDNDCNGQIDDGNPGGGAECPTGRPEPCQGGILTCLSGELICQAQPEGPEACDGLDNDCDGEIDEDDPVLGQACSTGLSGPCREGLRECQGGQMVCVPKSEGSEEICDGSDNDCDGEVDEGDPGGGQSCDTGLEGDCRSGTLHCVAGEVICVGHITPAEEICDGLDNDCDGQADEDNPGAGGVCFTGQPGICALGTMVCSEASRQCQADFSPREESCNYLDDDCDGQIDEEVMNACGWCGPLPEEFCDGNDNDCDGEVDEGNLCPTGAVCYKGLCLVACPFGECFGEHSSCVDDVCMPCGQEICPEGWECLEGACLNPCRGVSCPEGQACLLGTCVEDTCHLLGCEEGYLCVLGVCEEDPCQGKTCSGDTFCRDGVCVKSCAHVSCPGGERCRDGLCVEDPCALVECWMGYVCDPATAECYLDPCLSVICPLGMVCQGGDCQGDPCLNINCPPLQRCEGGQCVGDWEVEDPLPLDPDAALPDGGPLEDAPAPLDLEDKAALDDASSPAPPPEPGSCGCHLAP